MKYIITLLLTGLCFIGNAQRNTNQYSRSTDDDGKTLKLILKVRNDTASFDFERTFDVAGMNKKQKDDLENHIIDSLGLSKYFKPTTSTTLISSTYKASEKNSIATAVMDYIDAFYFGDTSKITRSISPEVVKYGYYRKKEETTYAGQPMRYRQMIDYALRVKAKNNIAAAEKLYKKTEILDYQDQTASAKVTAWWGTDYILLGKINDKWMITHVLWQSPPVQGW